MMRRDVIARLQAQAEAVRGMGATALYLFGSHRRDTAMPESDIDLLVEYDPATRFDAFDLVGIKLLLEERIGVPVDITTRDGLHPRLRRTRSSGAS